MAALECERETGRKRKERRDSGCTHERKERRPTSEERPPPPPPLHDSNRLETERRTERLSRARCSQTKRRRPVARLRLIQDSHQSEERARTPSPTLLDLVAWNRLGAEEPELSWRADRSPLPSVRAVPIEKVETFNPEQRLSKIKRKMHTLKKNILKYETDFEMQYGRPITQTDRMTDVQLTRMYETFQHLQAEKRCLKADPEEYALKLQAAKKQKQLDEKMEAALKTDKVMADVVVDIEEWLSSCRETEGRAGPPSTWTTAQLSAEKFCVQKALLRLEASRGRPPTHSADRGAARHLYDQYRQVKRDLATRNDANVGALTELATILEHEPMLFATSSVDSSSDSQEKQSDTTSENTSSKMSLTAPSNKLDIEDASSNSSPKSNEEISGELSNLPSNESLHCLSLDELTKILCETKIQKSILRKTIKEHETMLESQNKRISKEENKIKEEDYVRYKAIKARLRLINALMTKQKIPKMN